MIIPHVEENLDRGRFVMEQAVPERCPCCGEPARIHESRSVENGKDKITKTLFCDNQSCETRRLRQFVHFASQKAMNIEGLSEATLELGNSSEKGGFTPTWISMGLTGIRTRS